MTDEENEEERLTEQQQDICDVLKVCLSQRKYDLAKETLKKYKGVLPEEEYKHYEERLKEGLKREEEKSKLEKGVEGEKNNS